MKRLLHYLLRRFYLRGTTPLGLVNTLLAFIFNRVLVRHSDVHGNTIGWSIKRGTDFSRTDDEMKK